MYAAGAERAAQRRLGEEAGERHNRHNETAGIGAERRGHHALAIGDEAAATDAAATGDDAGAGMQVARDLSGLGAFGWLVAQDEAIDGDLVAHLARQVLGTVGVVIADHPDQARQPSQGAQRLGVVTGQAVFGLAVVKVSPSRTTASGRVASASACRRRRVSRVS